MTEPKQTKQQFQAILNNFDTNIEEVFKLLNFDRVILNLCISNLETLEEKLKAKQNISNPTYLPTKTITLLKNIHSNDSLKLQYKTIFNQTLVLLVSHFSSALHTMFKTLLKTVFDNSFDSKILKEEIKVSIEVLKDKHYDMSEYIADVLIAKKDYSFQDMQSTKRAFEECISYSPKKTEEVNNVILAQAARHAIVHSGAIADSKFIRQVSGASPRRIKQSVQEGMYISFSIEEIEIIAKSMKTYLTNLMNAITAKL